MKKYLFVVLFVICLFVLTACASSPISSSGFGFIDEKSSSSLFSSNTAVMPMSEYYDNDILALEESLTPAKMDSISGGYDGIENLPAGVEARKVVMSAEFRVITDDFANSLRRLEQKIVISGGYIQQSDSRVATEYRAAFASMTIRVPVALYGDFKAFLTDFANLDSVSEHGEDVTVQYYDTEARLKVLQAQETRIKTFIAESKDLDEIFKIERELTRISTEIEQLTTVKNRLDNLTAYATVYVEISEKIIEEVKSDTFSTRITKAFKGALAGSLLAAQLIVILLAWIWPLLILAGIVLLILRGKSKRKAAAAGKNFVPPAPTTTEIDDQ